MIIEYDGEQHFKQVARFGGEKRFEMTKSSDFRKNCYCIDNGLIIYRFSYKLDFEDIEKLLIKFLKNKKIKYHFFAKNNEYDTAKKELDEYIC